MFSCNRNTQSNIFDHKGHVIMHHEATQLNRDYQHSHGRTHNYNIIMSHVSPTTALVLSFEQLKSRNKDDHTTYNITNHQDQITKQRSTGFFSSLKPTAELCSSQNIDI